MYRPQPLTRRFITKRILDAYGLEHLLDTDVKTEWAPDWEAVRFTFKSNDKQSIWYPVASEIFQAAENDAVRALINWPVPAEIKDIS